MPGSADALDPDGLDPDPVQQFEQWIAHARDAGVRQPEAMTVATVDADGLPTARTVLLRGLDERGFAFYTNLESEKARDLAQHPFAAAVFHWREVERQVRVRGPVLPIDRAEAEAYWATRPRGHRIGAWASPQSEVIASRATLLANAARYGAQFMLKPPRAEKPRNSPVEPTTRWQGIMIGAGLVAMTRPTARAAAGEPQAAANCP